ncbi:MAG: DUF4056 domain-containing protein [Prolixibacteraceae bacterium]
MRLIRYIFLVLICHLPYILAAKAPVFTEKDYLKHPPRIIRACCAFGTDLKVSIIPGLRYTQLTSPELLGPHHYLGGKSENNGILYTRRGGFVDFGHLRDLIDWTAYLYNLAKKSQQTGEILINLGYESGNKSLYLKVPPTEKDEEILKLACRIAYDISIFHEITSWFGASAVPLLPEKFSSFSIEDAFSNMLGTKIAEKAINSDLPYEQAVTETIKQFLVELETVSTKEESYNAMEGVRDIWWTRKRHLPNNHVMIQRELGVYTKMTPWLVPGWESKNLTPCELTIPETTSDGIPLSEFYTLTYNLNNKIPLRKIFPERTKRVVTQNDFKQIIDYMAIGMQKKHIQYKLKK